jgi:drug/metabolite transporter (DMT)-like permease
VNLPWPAAAALVASGILGLGIGDIFLLNAYARMGAARTLILYGFQPFFIGALSYFFFGQELAGQRMVAVFFFVGCLFTFSLEKYRQAGHWEIPGLVAALVGVAFDNCGVVLSRWAFDQVPAMDALQANFLRCSGALAFYAVFAQVRRVDLAKGWRKLDRGGKKLAFISAAMGTFLALFLYLTAVKIGHLASISALGVVGPILTSAMECAYYRKAPSKYLLTALALFLGGFSLLMLA